MEKTYDVKFETVETVVRTNSCKIVANSAEDAYEVVRKAIDNGVSAIYELPIENGEINRVVQIDDYLIGNSGGTDGFTAKDAKVVATTLFEDTAYTYNEDIESCVFDNDSQRGMLEDYCKDMVQVNDIHEADPKKIWRAVDADDGRVHLKAGKGQGRCIYYVITNESWTDADEEYFLCEEPDNTPLGAK